MKRFFKVLVITTAIAFGISLGSWLFIIFLGNFFEGRTPTNRQVVQQGQKLPTYDREELLYQTNLERDKAGVLPLSLDSVLNDTAQAKCEHVVQTDDYSHGDVESIRVGIDRWILGENMALGVSSSEEVVEEWSASPTHYANLVDSRFNKVGFAFCEFRGAVLKVQHFSE